MSDRPAQKTGPARLLLRKFHWRTRRTAKNAAEQCYKDKRNDKECCEEVLDGDKKQIAQCVTLVAERRKTIADKKQSAQK